MDKKLKGVFSQRWLAASDEYYYPLFNNLFYALYHNLRNKGYDILKGDMEITPELIKERVTAKGYIFSDTEYRGWKYLLMGNGDFGEIETSINANNRGFIKLLELGEPLVAMAFIRLQLENVTYLYAELKYPYKVLYNVFNKGKSLNDIDINKEPLCASKIRKEIDQKKGSNIYELYRLYSGFIHPSIKHNSLDNLGRYNPISKQIHLTKLEIKKLCKDMVIVNKIIVNLLKEQISVLNNKSQPN